MAQNAALQAQAASNGVLFEQRFSVAEPIVQMTGVEPDLALTGGAREARARGGSEPHFLDSQRKRGTSCARKRR